MSCATERGNFPPLPEKYRAFEPDITGGEPAVLHCTAIRDERNNGVVREYDVNDIDALLQVLDSIDTATQVKILVTLARALGLHKALEAVGLTPSSMVSR